ncbi:hypothetical protein KR032_010397 [Drosophila birchii]|nr:hypothetical protein KR032_010397 [Drosophila birchii]
MEGRQLTKCVYHSGKCLYQLLACACRNSVQKVVCLCSVGSVEKFLHGNCGLENRILLVEKIQPLCLEIRDSRMPHGDIRPCGPSAVLQIEQKLLRVTQFIGRLLCPVPLQTVLKILNPFGHSWNMLQDDDSESDSQEEENLESCPERLINI